MTSLKLRLGNGESVVGTMVALFDTPQIACVIKSAGFDFFIVDCEHGPFDSARLASILVLAKEAGIPALVRVPEARREVILRCMESGAQGLLLPNTETAEQARTLVACAKYAPLGNRGVALIREHTSFKKPDNVGEYMQVTNETTLLMVQIESPMGLENLEAILDVEGIDVAFVGPADLSQSLGIMGQLDNPQFTAALERIINTARSKGKFSGIHLMETDRLAFWQNQGMSCNMFSSDVNLLLSAASDALKKLRK